jgi:hypothetical protein
MHKALATFLAVTFSALALLACGDDHPGGTVGAACSNVGSSDECEGGEVCEAIADGDAYCLQRCDDQAECGATERCNGLSGESGKACHPNGEDEFDGAEVEEDGVGDEKKKG